MTSSAAVAHAQVRFGFGARPDQPAPTDPVAWLTGQLQRATPVPGPSLSDCLTPYATMINGGGNQRDACLRIRVSEADNLIWQAVTTDQPFYERLIRFFANHFGLQGQANYIAGCSVGAFVRDVLRKHLFGKYADMLTAAVTHPALVASLSNYKSMAPNSTRARRLRARGQDAGLNENLARETLELFSVGVGAGYAQADVTAMATLLAGFTVNLQTKPYGGVYDPTMAAGTGMSSVIGVSYPNNNLGCLQALQALGTSDYTYRRLARKLAVHFISDQPYIGDVNKIFVALRQSGGDIRQAVLALISLDSAWRPLTKVKDIQDYNISSMRAVGLVANPAVTPSLAMAKMGQPVLAPPFPNGWDDQTSTWSGPWSVMQRLAFANYVVGVGPTPAPDTLLENTVAPLLRSYTASTLPALLAASTPSDSVKTILTLPEFLRR